MTLPPSGPPRPADPRTLRAPTSEETLAAAMRELDGLADRPLAEHVTVFEQVHAALGAALADRAHADGPTAGGAPGRA